MNKCSKKDCVYNLGDDCLQSINTLDIDNSISCIFYTSKPLKNEKLLFLVNRYITSKFRFSTLSDNLKTDAMKRETKLLYMKLKTLRSVHENNNRSEVDK